MDKTDRQKEKAKPDLLCDWKTFVYDMMDLFVEVIQNFYQGSKFYVFYTVNPIQEVGVKIVHLRHKQ